MITPALLGVIASTRSGESDPEFANVLLLLNMQGSNGSTSVVDSSSYAKSITVNGNAQLSDSQGFSSCLMDGTGNYLETDSYSPTVAIAGDFTMEAFFYSTATGSRDVIQMRQAGVPDTMWMIFRNSSNKLCLFVGSSASGFTRIVGTTTVNLNQLYHCALTRSGLTIYLWLDGVLEGSWTSGSAGFQGDSSANMAFYKSIVGSFYGLSEYWIGNIGACRITNGVARYTGTFTPPSAPFPTS